MAEKYTEMRSSSFTKEQANAIDAVCKAEDRTSSALIRRAVCQYLESKMALNNQEMLHTEEE